MNGSEGKEADRSLIGGYVSWHSWHAFIGDFKCRNFTVIYTTRTFLLIPQTGCYMKRTRC